MKNKDIVSLKNVIREDITRIINWLDDKDIYENWFGKYTYNESAHLGYEPKNMINATESEWNEVFHDPHHEPHRSIFSIYLNNKHIGEAQLSIDESLGDSQISILIGEKKYWHKGIGTEAALALLEHSFLNLGMYRCWVDIPEFNTNAIKLFKKIGFIHEGTFRKSRPKNDQRYNSVVMGVLIEEYTSKYPDGISSHVIEWDGKEI
jgi:RimJ/RimL family protein N-acetyltransferase